MIDVLKMILMCTWIEVNDDIVFVKFDTKISIFENDTAIDIDQYQNIKNTENSNIIT